MTSPTGPDTGSPPTGPGNPRNGGSGTTGPGRVCRDCVHAVALLVGSALRGRRKFTGPCTHEAAWR